MSFSKIMKPMSTLPGTRILKELQANMEERINKRELNLPLQLQFAMRRAEIQADEMTWDQLRNALLRLYQTRLLEWSALKDILSEEQIEIENDIPTHTELIQLSSMFADDEDDEDENDDRRQCCFV